MKNIWTFMNGTKKDLQERVGELNDLIGKKVFTFEKHDRVF